jgi:cyanate permease
MDQSRCLTHLVVVLVLGGFGLLAAPLPAAVIWLLASLAWGIALILALLPSCRNGNQIDAESAFDVQSI